MTYERFDTRLFEYGTTQSKPQITLPTRADPRIRQVHDALDWLECAPPPQSIGEQQWYDLLKDLRHVASKWLDIALACGWSLTDLFGCPPGLRGRVGLMGVAVLLKGREIESIDQNGIVISNRLGPPNTFLRQSPASSAPFDRRGSVLIWDVVAKEQNQ